MDQVFPWLQTHDFGGLDRDFAGYLASALVLATFSMQSMRRLRATAIASNLAFILYALIARLHPILVLHATLLPLNMVRLAQINRPSATQNPVSAPVVHAPVSTVVRANSIACPHPPQTRNPARPAYPTTRSASRVTT